MKDEMITFPYYSTSRAAEVSVVGVTILYQAVRDEVTAQDLLAVKLLRGCIDRPRHHFNASPVPLLHVISAG